MVRGLQQPRCTLILAQSKLLVAARDVAPPEDSRPSSALGVLGFPADSSFTASPCAAVSTAPVDPAAEGTNSSCFCTGQLPSSAHSLLCCALPH